MVTPNHQCYLCATGVSFTQLLVYSHVNSLQVKKTAIISDDVEILLCSKFVVKSLEMVLSPWVQNVPVTKVTFYSIVNRKKYLFSQHTDKLCHSKS